MLEKSKLPAKEIEFTIDGNKYKIPYPNNGQMLQIESMKISLTRSTYSSMTGSDTIIGQIARYTVDMIALLSVCCPEIKKDLMVETFSDLDALSNKRLLDAYVKQIIPWLREWEEILNSEEEVEKN